MLRPFPMAALLICLAGCGSNASKPDSGYGRFITGATAAYESQMADDSVRQLVSLYPPASTRLTMDQEAPDQFGTRLIEQLRAQGYALQEAVQPPAAPQSNRPSALPEESGAASLNYVLDTVSSPNLYRVTLKVGNQTISRAYLARSNVIHPAGAWARKE